MTERRSRREMEKYSAEVDGKIFSAEIRLEDLRVQMENLFGKILLVEEIGGLSVPPEVITAYRDIERKTEEARADLSGLSRNISLTDLVGKVIHDDYRRRHPLFNQSTRFECYEGVVTREYLHNWDRYRVYTGRRYEVFDLAFVEEIDVLYWRRG